MGKELPILLGVPLLFVGLGALAAWPQLAHTFDSGHDEATVETLPTKALTSHNVTLRGTVRKDMEVELEITKKRKGKVEASHTVRYYPFVPKGWQPKQPVTVLLSVDDWPRFLESTRGGFDDVAIEGTLRTVAWEKPEPKVVEAFESGGQPIAPDARWFQQGKPHDVEKALGYPVAGLVVGVLLVLQAKRRMGAAPKA